MLASLLDRTANFIFLLVSLLSGFTAVYFTQNVRKRADLIRAGFAVGALNLLCAIVARPGRTARNWIALGWQALFGIGAGIGTALVVSAILPLVEGAFQITTTISWLELADLNHPLLQQMTMEAPGTYHHSLLVANLAEAGAKAIGLDATACRVMAYFHDIGKIIKPEYFTENIPPGANPHENLSPSMSALIIIAHVKEGIDLALKYGLKKQVLDAIQQHHGDSVVSYFHQRALQQQQDAREGGKIMNMREEDVPEVSENSFRYPGPRPQTQGDRRCSASPTRSRRPRARWRSRRAQRIEDMVNEIVAHKIADRQLDECNLTMNEIRAAAEAMSVTLKNMMHTRISYAKKEKTECEYGCQTNKAKFRCGSVRFCGGLRRRCRCCPARCRRSSRRSRSCWSIARPWRGSTADFLGDPDRDRRDHLSLRRNSGLPRRGAGSRGQLRARSGAGGAALRPARLAPPRRLRRHDAQAGEGDGGRAGAIAEAGCSGGL